MKIFQFLKGRKKKKELPEELAKKEKVTAYDVIASCLNLQEEADNIYVDNRGGRFVLTKYGFRPEEQFNWEMKYTSLRQEMLVLQNKESLEAENKSRMQEKIKIQKEELQTALENIGKYKKSNLELKQENQELKNNNYSLTEANKRLNTKNHKITDQKNQLLEHQKEKKILLTDAVHELANVSNSAKFVFDEISTIFGEHKEFLRLNEERESEKNFNVENEYEKFRQLIIETILKLERVLTNQKNIRTKLKKLEVKNSDLLVNLDFFLKLP